MSRKVLFSVFCICTLLMTAGCTVTPKAKPLPAWEQVNAPDVVSQNQWITSLQVFKGRLYAVISGNQSPGSGYKSPSFFEIALFRSSDGTHWEKIEPMSFHYQQNFHFGVLQRRLYVGGIKPGKTLNSAGLWRTTDGETWETVTSDGFGDITNYSVYPFAEYQGGLYAATASVLGAQVWRSRNGEEGTWVRVFNTRNPNATSPTSLYVYGGRLYAAIETDWEKNFELWSTGDGEQWQRVGTSTFESTNVASSNLIEFKGALYVGIASMKVHMDHSSAIRIDFQKPPCVEMAPLNTENLLGGQLWRSTDGAQWTKVLDGGMGDVKNWKFESLTIFEGDLYAVLDGLSGLTIWRSSDGLNWTDVSKPGFGKVNNATGHWLNSKAIFHHQLYIGTTPFPGTGDGEIWRTVKR